MKHRYKDIEGSRREFIIELSPEEVKERLDRIYDQLKETVEIPGFRPGKAPRDIIEKHHKEAAREKALSTLISDSYKKALLESKTRPLGLPLVSDVKFAEEKELSFKATVDIQPKIDLKRYKNIKLEKKPVNIKDADVDMYLAVLQESYAQFKSVEDRPAKLGDYLICDIACEVDGRPIQKEQKNIWLPLDKEHSLPELIDGLAGAKRNEKREIKAVLPENRDEPKYSKKEALFKIDVNEIKEKTLPEINDDFVKTLGAHQNVAELKEAVRGDLTRKAESRVKMDMEHQILEELLKENAFTPPQGLVDEEIETLVEETKKDLSKKNIKKEDIEKEEPEIRKRLKIEAVRRIRLYFILDEIARIENIDVSDSEIDDTLGLLAQQSNMTKEDVKKYYIDNHLLESLKYQLRKDKTIGFLLKNADINDK